MCRFSSSVICLTIVNSLTNEKPYQNFVFIIVQKSFPIFDPQNKENK